DINGYTFVRAEDLTVGTNNDENIVKVYYSKDEKGPEGGSDDIPDRYQVTFTYAAGTNGKVEGTTTEVKTVQEITRDSVTGEITNVGPVVAQNPTQPSTVTADEGYRFYKWNDGAADYATDDALKAAGFTTDMTFTANFTEREDLFYEVHYFYDMVEDSASTVVANNGKFNAQIPYDETSPKTFDGKNYILESVEKLSEGIITTDSAKNIINVYYTLDNNGPEEEPDEVPDKIQHGVTYDGNGNTSGTVPVDAAIYSATDDITLKDKGALARENAVFGGWSYEATALLETQEAEDAVNLVPNPFRISTDTTVYAVWAADTNGNEIPDYKESYTLTINYSYAAGSNGDLAELPATYTQTLGVNAPYSVASKTIEGFNVNTAVVEGTIVDHNVTVNVVYTRRTYTVTVTDPDGNVVGEIEVPHGDDVTDDEIIDTLPEDKQDNYDGVTNPDDLVDVTEDITITVNYTYTVTVQDINGATVQTIRVPHGGTANPAVPAVEGQTFTGWTFISGGTSLENITSDMTIRAAYTAVIIPAPVDPVVPVAPTPDATPTPAVIPAPAAPVAAAPAAVTTIAEPEVPLAAEPDDNADYDLSVIDEEEVPLADMDDHKCCILHFLLLCLGLLIEIWYTHDQKKRQKRIFELREMLSEKTNGEIR
ncbi:MAG: hypothetical protein EOM34_06825, partial [Clostridia bacterium]|nr:hypothetical protein [Clostridia bacterium]NCD02578.1 hypothetical protein [Clostridia bacterium]